MTTLTLSGENIHSFDDLYAQVIKSLHLDPTKFGYNLDALYDVLWDVTLESIHIERNTLLKKNLCKNHKSGTSQYLALLDLLSDLPVRLTLE